MQINGRKITYIGNRTWKVDGLRATLAAYGSNDLKIVDTGEIVPVSAEQASALELEFRSPRQPAASARPITPENLAYHMYNPNGRLYG